MPGLLKTVAARMMLALRAVHSGQAAPDAPTQSSFQLKDSVWSDAMLQTAGYLRLGSRAVRADLAERLAGALSQARRGSETSAFVAPPELAASPPPLPLCRRIAVTRTMLSMMSRISRNVITIGRPCD